MDDWQKWERVLSPAAVKLWKHLSRYPEADTTMGELTRTLGCSKTAVRQAIEELTGHGFIAVTPEVDYE